MALAAIHTSPSRRNFAMSRQACLSVFKVSRSRAFTWMMRAPVPGQCPVRRVKHFHNGVHAVSLRLLPENADVRASGVRRTMSSNAEAGVEAVSHHLNAEKMKSLRRSGSPARPMRSK